MLDSEAGQRSWAEDYSDLKNIFQSNLAPVVKSGHSRYVRSCSRSPGSPRSRPQPELWRDLHRPCSKCFLVCFHIALENSEKAPPHPGRIRAHNRSGLCQDTPRTSGDASRQTARKPLHNHFTWIPPFIIGSSTAIKL